jgi:hypothetical protein
MSTLDTYTSGTRPLASANTGLCIFRTDTKAIEVSDGTNWLAYDYDSISYTPITNSLSVELDGTGDYLDCGTDSALDLTGGFTLNCYVKQDDTGINTVLQRRGSGTTGYQITLEGGNFQYFGNTFQSGLNSTTDFYMLTVTHTGSELKGYVNGSLANTFTNTYTSATSANFYIGRNALGSGLYDLHGFIDEVGVWSRVLNGSEISSIYNSGNGPVNISSSPNLVGYWRMGDGSGDTNSSSGTPTAGDSVGTVKNLANPGTHDGTGSGGALYSSTKP